MPSKNLIDGVKSGEKVEEDNSNQLYGDWTKWGRCTRRCKRVRFRHCVSEACRESVLREERPCAGDRCPVEANPVILENTSVVIQKGRTPADLQELYRMRSVIYGSWSDWTPCSLGCRTKRRKKCEFVGICGNSAIEEDAFCYDRGSHCERLYNDKKRKTSISLTSTPPKIQKSFRSKSDFYSYKTSSTLS